MITLLFAQILNAQNMDILCYGNINIKYHLLRISVQYPLFFKINEILKFASLIYYTQMSEESSFHDSSSSEQSHHKNHKKKSQPPKKLYQTERDSPQSDQTDSYNLQCKRDTKLTLNNPNSQVKQVHLPQTISIDRTTAYHIADLPKILRMLFIDVLCRGYHLNRGFMNSTINKFCYDEGKNGSQHLDLIYLSNDEAMGQIWRCVARQLGRPYKQYDFRKLNMQLMEKIEQINERSQIFQIEKIQMQQSPKLQQYNEIQKKMKQVHKNINGQMQKIQQNINKVSDETKRKNQAITNVIRQQILNLQKDIFIKTIVAIRKQKSNPTKLVQIILQQTYPTIIWTIQKAKQKLGSHIVQEKMQVYERYEKKGLISSTDKNDIVIICHRCLHPLNKNTYNVKCKGNRASVIVNGTVLTDPFIYAHRILQQNIGKKPKQKYIHPYLVYYLERPSDKNASQKPLCNRYYCKKCKQIQTQIYESGDCKYCGGDCNCYRCSGMDTLTKMMSLYIDRGGRWDAIVKQFLFDFKHKSLKTERNNTNCSESVEQKSHMIMKSFLEDKIFIKPEDIKDKEQYKIVYLTKNVQQYDRRALTYINKKEREKQIRLRPSKDTLQQQRFNEEKNLQRQKMLLARLEDNLESGSDNGNADKRGQKSQNQQKLNNDDIFYDEEDS